MFSTLIIIGVVAVATAKAGHLLSTPIHVAEEIYPEPIPVYPAPFPVARKVIAAPVAITKQVIPVHKPQDVTYSRTDVISRKITGSAPHAFRSHELPLFYDAPAPHSIKHTHYTEENYVRGKGGFEQAQESEQSEQAQESDQSEQAQESEQSEQAQESEQKEQAPGVEANFRRIYVDVPEPPRVDVRYRPSQLERLSSQRSQARPQKPAAVEIPAPILRSNPIPLPITRSNDELSRNAPIFSDPAPLLQMRGSEVFNEPASLTQVRQSEAIALPAPQPRIQALPAPVDLPAPQPRAQALPAPIALPALQPRIQALPSPVDFPAPQLRIQALPAPVDLPAPQPRIQALPAPVDYTVPEPAPVSYFAPAPVQQIQGLAPLSVGYPLPPAQINDYRRTYFTPIDALPYNYAPQSHPIAQEVVQDYPRPCDDRPAIAENRLNFNSPARTEIRHGPDAVSTYY